MISDALPNPGRTTVEDMSTTRRPFRCGRFHGTAPRKDAIYLAARASSRGGRPSRRSTHQRSWERGTRHHETGGAKPALRPSWAIIALGNGCVLRPENEMPG